MDLADVAAALSRGITTIRPGETDERAALAQGSVEAQDRQSRAVVVLATEMSSSVQTMQLEGLLLPALSPISIFK